MHPGVPSEADGAGRSDCAAVKPDIAVVFADLKNPQGATGPSAGYPAVLETKTGLMSRAVQPAVAYGAEAKIGLFVRAGPFAGEDVVAMLKHEDVDRAHADAHDPFQRHTR